MEKLVYERLSAEKCGFVKGFYRCGINNICFILSNNVNDKDKVLIDWLVVCKKTNI